MLPELGHFALAFAFAICAVQGPTLLLAGARAPAGYAAFAARASLLAFAAVALAFAALMHGYATSDFSLVNVYENSHTAKPFLFKLTGTWGNHEGSMLLWALVLTGFGAALAATSRRLPADLATPALGVQALIGAAFLAFLLFTSNPFERLSPTPADGTGLNPLLQDVGLAIHPPFLYLGYVGFSVPFSLAVAGLLAGRVDAAWGRAARPWALAAWSFLTVGITLGAWWAYYELGWGGWWAWDPVENASFMPWLVGTALIHSVRVVERRDALKAWAVLLAILAFSLSLVGTFLVRSGVLTSVHAFAVDPARGVFILAILAAAVGGSLTLYALRADKLSAGGAYAPVSREGALLFNNVLMAVAAATVFLGTFYPLFADVVSGAKISVGAPYFNAVFTPIAAATLALAAAGPLVAWKKGDLAFVGRRMAFAGAAALAGLVVALTLADRNALAGALGVALALWLAGGALSDLANRAGLFRKSDRGDALRRLAGTPRAAWGGARAPGGLALFAFGAFGVSLWKTETVVFLKPGEAAPVAGYAVTLDRVAPTTRENFQAETAYLTARKGGRAIALQAERRFYPVRRMQTTEAAIRPRAHGDLYVTFGERVEGRGWPVRLTFHPFAGALWWGAGLAAFGGLLALTDRGKRPRAAASQETTGPTAVGVPSPAE